jgi:CheY-like chemotaxis protein
MAHEGAMQGEGAMDAKKVLVVDDSKLLHRMYEVMLKGKTLVFALDGVEAIERLGEHPDVELVLLDINMPRMNGLECLAHMKAHPTLSRVPVIVVSTEGREDDAKRALAAGAAAYVTKPFRHESLRQAMASIGRAP